MTEVKDDPREVLALLNSLGFVGITAPQLKAFMKDLKLHRKIKEHQRQQWKDETRKKILSKQETVLKEMLYETLAAERSQPRQNSSSSESSLQQNDSIVRISVRCVANEDESEDIENQTRHNIQARPPKRKAHVKKDKFCGTECQGTLEESSDPVDSGVRNRRREQSKSRDRFRVAEASTDSSQYVSVDRKKDLPQKSGEKAVHHVRDSVVRPKSAPEFSNQADIPKERSKSVASDPTGLNNARNIPSRCSTQSHTKSFIRPWRLQPESQRAARTRKSDPVALYQKYRQEWKQISFPGEEQHARVRWAIREKMLGTDPNPRPILKNSQSLQSIKKR